MPNFVSEAVVILYSPSSIFMLVQLVLSDILPRSGTLSFIEVFVLVSILQMLLLGLITFALDIVVGSIGGCGWGATVNVYRRHYKLTPACTFVSKPIATRTTALVSQTQLCHRHYHCNTTTTILSPSLSPSVYHRRHHHHRRPHSRFAFSTGGCEYAKSSDWSSLTRITPNRSIIEDISCDKINVGLNITIFAVNAGIALVRLHLQNSKN